MDWQTVFDKMSKPAFVVRSLLSISLSCGRLIFLLLALTSLTPVWARDSSTVGLFSTLASCATSASKFRSSVRAGRRFRAALLHLSSARLALTPRFFCLRWPGRLSVASFVRAGAFVQATLGATRFLHLVHGSSPPPYTSRRRSTHLLRSIISCPTPFCFLLLATFFRLSVDSVCSKSRDRAPVERPTCLVLG